MILAVRDTEEVSPRRTRAENRAHMEARILEVGREHLVRYGAAGLSLRAIAREIGSASSAVYRYVDSRDALLTLLLVDAYTSLADAVDEEIQLADGTPGDPTVLALAMRHWALEHHEQWGLIYGAPVPGYRAPAERTSEPGTRVMRRLVQIMAERETLPEGREIPAEYTSFLATGIAELDVNASVAAAALAVRAWCTIVGTISMELHGQLGPELSASPELGRAILIDALTPFRP